MVFKLFSTGSRSSGGGSGDVQPLYDLLHGMIRGLVDNPEEVQLTHTVTDDGDYSFELRVSKSDLGKVIGKKGRTASAMRTLLSAASRKQQKNADLRIVE